MQVHSVLCKILGNYSSFSNRKALIHSKIEFENDSDLAVHLETAKADLQGYFKVNYLSPQAAAENAYQ